MILTRQTAESKMHVPSDREGRFWQAVRIFEN